MSQNNATVESSKLALYGTIIVAVIGVATAAVTSYSNYLSNRVQVELPIITTQTAEARIRAETQGVTTPIPDHTRALALNAVQNLASRNLLTTTSGAVIWQSDEVSYKQTAQNRLWLVSVQSAPTDFVIFSSVAWSSSDADLAACGFFFRGDDRGSHYAALLRRSGNAVLWRMSDAGVDKSVQSVLIQGIDKDEQGINRLMLIAQGSRFVFLVNDAVVYDGADAVYATGYVGLVTGSGPAGDTTCTFRDSWLWAIR